MAREVAATNVFPASMPVPICTGTGPVSHPTVTSGSTGRVWRPAPSRPTTARPACSSADHRHGWTPRCVLAGHRPPPSTDSRTRSASANGFGPRTRLGSDPVRPIPAARLPADRAGPGLGAGRRRRTLDGSDEHPRHDVGLAGCRTAGRLHHLPGPPQPGIGGQLPAHPRSPLAADVAGLRSRSPPSGGTWSHPRRCCAACPPR